MIQTLIIGGGLSGLALADLLHQQGQEVHLLEARSRFGGRIKTVDTLDLGPSWFWPGQPRIAAAITRFGLTRFDQFAAGALSFEDATGAVTRDRGLSAMQGAWRLSGGIGKLVDAVVSHLPVDRLHLNSAVTSMTRTATGTDVTLADGTVWQARTVVLALPPRIAAKLTFDPPLPDAALHSAQAIPTWMAGQAKAVATYPATFWRDAGLSGDAFSHHGPLAEIHDASGPGGTTPALFGFLGLPASARTDVPGLKTAILSQLTRIFGPQASQPTTLHLQDWATAPFTATPRDHTPNHPSGGLPAPLTNLWDGTLHLCSTEIARQSSGLLEGALEAAAATFQKVCRAR